LPHPKEIIRQAFAIILDTMERYQFEHWRGVSKDVYFITAQALDICFAPDDEVPEDRLENISVYNQRQEQMGLLPPTDVAAEYRRIKANPEAEDRMLESMGLPKELRDLVIKAAIAAAEKGERDAKG
jgi:hypothetical protein